VVTRSLLVVLAVASLPTAHAHAHPVLDIANDPPPPPIQPVIAVTPPVPEVPPWQSIGATLGFVSYHAFGRERIGVTYGVVWGRELLGRLQLFAGYDFVFTTTGGVQPDGTREEIRRASVRCARSRDRGGRRAAPRSGPLGDEPRDHEEAPARRSVAITCAPVSAGPPSTCGVCAVDVDVRAHADRAPARA
jgi:hypothetical protein